MLYTLDLVSTNPNVERLEELERVWGDGGSVDPANLVYLTGVVTETLRLYPPGFVINRKLTKPFQLSNGVVVPKDTLMLIPIYMIQHDPK